MTPIGVRLPTLNLVISEKEMYRVLLMQMVEWSHSLDPDWHDPTDGRVFPVNNSFDPAGETFLELRFLEWRQYHNC
jgi:hypothetical protein